MKKQETKLYFQDTDSTRCQSLEDFMHDAKIENLKEIILLEAVPDDGSSEFIWCAQYGECIERDNCKKSLCSYYESKSGRGVCSNRGTLYFHGEEVKFEVK